MAITIGLASFATGTAAGGSGTEPASALLGDLFVSLTVVSATSSALLKPTGWSNLFNNTTGAGGFDYDISYTIRGASAPSLAWTWTTSNYYEIHIIRFAGVDPANPFNAQSTLVTSTTAQQGGTRALSDIDCGAVVTTKANTVALAIATQWAGSGAAGWTAPTNYTFKSTNTAGIDGMFATRALAASGSEDPDEFFTNQTNVAHMIAVVLALNEAGASAKRIQSRPFPFKPGSPNILPRGR